MMPLLKERIKKKLLIYFPDLYDNVDYLVEGRSFKGPSSNPIFLFTICESYSKIAKELFVKLAPVFPENNEGLTEFNLLSRLATRLKGNLRVIRPLDFYEDINALLTEKIDGKNLKRVLLQNNSYFSGQAAKERIIYYIILSARWLKELGNIDDRIEQDFSIEDIINKGNLNEFIVSLNLPTHQMADVTIAINNLLSRRERIRLPLTTFHGDFGPGNIIVNGDSIYVLDLSYNGKAPIYFDIGCFLVSLDTINPFPRQIFYRYNALEELKTIFLREYFGILSKRDIYYSHIYYLKHLIDRYYLQKKRLDKFPIFIKNGIDALWLKRLYARLLCKNIASINACVEGHG